MKNTQRSSSRVVIDLQACQTAGSAKRGVGRYSYELFNGILRNRGVEDIWALLGSGLPHDVDLSLFNQSRAIRLPEYKDWPTERSFRGGEQDRLDALAYNAFTGPLSGDIHHVSHIFEGFSDRVPLPAPNAKAAGQVLSTTLYDLIPLLYQDHYFQSTEFQNWYLSRLSWLREADLLLAISESSRQDAINLLGIEPSRITTIHGGIASHFQPSTQRKRLREELTQRYKLRTRFVLYTGGDDYRKNIDGAIAGFSKMPKELRRECHLVVICAMEPQRKEMYLELARKSGLDESDVIITGFVSENDLIAFYQTCDVFVFPSLYEGLGLPVLEAMACGAPVIGGNNSSIRELIVRQDALFNASSHESIAESLVKVLKNDDFASDLREYGLTRSKEFSWDKTSTLALEAFEEASARARQSGVSAATNGWLPKKRMAVLTPLPPCRSGIADYNAKFLPYLTRHFDIDLFVDNYEVEDETLTSSFRIFSVENFENVAPNYDVILYEFGNSEFHAHMLPLLEKFPGVVGLHDAYLSGLFGYFDFYLGDTGSYASEMLGAHGPLARRYFAPIAAHHDANSATMVELPCTKRILKSATGIISHSPFNLKTAQKYYPESWPAPYRIIPQMVPMPEICSDSQLSQVKKRLGFADSDLIITTFGHVAWTKWGDRLLEGFLASNLVENTKIHLIFAGELANDDFGNQLKASIEQAKLKNRIQITGYLSEQDYKHYLNITDVAIQLRTNSRGGTPKGVLDCLSHGIPVIVNDDASYKDYPDNVTLKLGANPSVNEIADILSKASSSASLRNNLSKIGLEYIRTHHDPSRCAAEYAAAIHEFSDRACQLKYGAISKSFAPHLAACTDPEGATREAAEWIESIQHRKFERRRLFIDVSHIANSDHQTGVPRVVKEIVRALYCSDQSGFEPVAVQLLDGKLKIAKDWLSINGLLLAQEQSSPDSSELTQFQPGDSLLMLDSSWARYKEFFPIFAQAKDCNVPVYTVIYDLLPLTLPPGNIVEGGKQWFSGWIKDAIEESDGLICISRAVADDVAQHIEILPDLSNTPKIGYWHLGSDFSSLEHKQSEQTITNTKLANRPYLLMVGTIEPRKSHALALQAMEQLWDEGEEICLCIAGKEGWMVDDLMKKIREHSELGKRLFFFENPTDSEMTSFYRNAEGLLFLSLGEGFGLPLVEAAHHGIPIVCSDIPVFKEIAGPHATYISLDGAQNVSSQLKSWLKVKKQGALPDSSKVSRLSWKESSEQLMKVIFDGTWYSPT